MKFIKLVEKLRLVILQIEQGVSSSITALGLDQEKIGDAQIVKLGGVPAHHAYTRVTQKGSPLYLKLNEQCHVKVYLKNGRWIGDGYGEEIDPNESVVPLD